MTSGVCEGMLAPSSFCCPNLGCESPLAETPKGSLGRGKGCTFPLPLWSSNRRESGGTGYCPIETHLLTGLEWDGSCTCCCPIETHLLTGLEWDVSCTVCCSIEPHLLIDLEWDVSCTGCSPIEPHLLTGLEWDVSCTGCCSIEPHLLTGRWTYNFQD